jgi:hypothetical protein
MKCVHPRPRYQTRLVVDPELLDRLEVVCNNESLEPGQSPRLDLLYEKTYLISQSDLENGSILL